MSVNNNASVSADNPFVELSSLKDANLNDRERAILSDCNYADLKIKWTEGLHNISNNARTHIRNVKEVKESFFCHLGNVLGFVNSEPLKEVHEVFSNFDLFDRYVRNDISPETYKKIAKANPAYFDKVIKHLEDSAKELDIKADARIDTFCSSSTGQALARAATRFRDTADYLKRMMHGDDAAKPGNNNANPGANSGNQPTVINHYNNNIHIGDNYFGNNHFGDNNFYNKGNMAVMFKGKSNGVQHTGFKSEHPALESPNSSYSPIINGKRFLDLTPKQVVQLAFEGDKDKGKKLELQHNERLMFKAEPLPKEKPENIEQTVNSIYLKPGKKENDTIPVKIPISENSFITKKRITKVNSVQSEKNSAETILTNLKKLRDKYYRLWDKIHRDKGSEHATANDNNFQNQLKKVDEKRRMQILETDSSFGKLGKLSMQIEDLITKLSTMNQKKTINGQQLSSAAADLKDITDVIKNDTKQAAIDKQRPQKTGNTLATENHGLSWEGHVKVKTPTEEEDKMSPDKAREHLAEETQKLLEDIRKELGLEPLKKK